MSYQPATGVNSPPPGYNPYYPYLIQPTYPFTPTYTPVRQPNVSPTTYDATQVGTSAPVRGRIVKVDTDISPSDVPMDGFSSYFPAEDGSCIYVKHWDKDGKIQTTKFVPVPNDTSDFVPTASFEDEMRERMDTLENLLRQRNTYKPKYQKQNGSEHKDGGNDVRSAKRHYTETHSEKDRQAMKEHANEHMAETMMTLREMWDDADPDLKTRMKADLVKLTSEMTV